MITGEQLNELEKKLIWVFGSPRSGSTWLANDVLKYKALVWNEPLIGLQLGAFTNDPNIHLAIILGIKGPKLTRILDGKNYENKLKFFSKKFEKTWKPSLRRLILERIGAEFGFSGFDYIAIKAPNEGQGSDIIMNCLPNSKLIFLVRDGRDVIDSRQSKAKNPRNMFDGPETPEERSFRIQHFAMLWNMMSDITRKAYDYHNPELRLLVKYEDLRLDSFNEIKKIYKFLGYDLPDEEIKKMVYETSFENIPKEHKGEDKGKRKAKPGGFTDYFTKGEIEMMNKIMKNNLREYGYKI